MNIAIIKDNIVINKVIFDNLETAEEEIRKVDFPGVEDYYAVEIPGDINIFTGDSYIDGEWIKFPNPIHKEEPVITEESEQDIERKQLFEELKRIALEEIVNNMIAGYISEESTVKSLFDDTEEMISERDGMIRRIREIDEELNGCSN